MRKIVVLVIALVFSLIMASAAFADQYDGLVIYGNSQVGSISDGQHGYSWNHSDGSPAMMAQVIGFLQQEFNDMNWQRNWNYYGGRYFFVDENGVNHYFNPNDRLVIYQTTDQNGNPIYYTVR